MSLGDIASFDGAGIYAIYYRGESKAYAKIAGMNRSKWRQPIYVGKAARKGSRKGTALSAESKGAAIYGRLKMHTRSIEGAKNLDIGDFWCRYLVAEEVFIPLCESLLIERYQPLWNVCIEGFGINPTGENRQQQVSAWDMLHPGRPGRGVKPNKKFKKKSDLIKVIQQFLDS